MSTKLKKISMLACENRTQNFVTMLLFRMFNFGVSKNKRNKKNKLTKVFFLFFFRNLKDDDDSNMIFFQPLYLVFILLTKIKKISKF